MNENNCCISTVRIVLKGLLVYSSRDSYRHYMFYFTGSLEILAWQRNWGLQSEGCQSACGEPQRN